MRDLAGRKVRLVEVETQRPSPFARSLLFGYVGAFLYEGDAPLAERRAAALALDSTLLGELLGRVDLRELLDPAVVAETERQLQLADRAAPPARRRGRRRAAARARRPVRGRAGRARRAPVGWLAELDAARRALRVRIAGEERWIGVEDAGRLRDALGVALPVGVAEAYLEPVADPLGDLVARYARTHGPFAAATCAARFGLGVFVVEQALRRLAADRPGGLRRVHPGRRRHRVVRRRGAAAAAPPLAGRAAPGDRAGAAARRWPRSCPAGSRSARRPRGVEALAAADRAAAGRGGAGLGAGAAGAARPGRRLLPRATSTSCAPAARWSGPGPARSPAATAGSPWPTPTPRRCCCPPPDEALALTPLHEAVLDALGRRAGAVLPQPRPTGSAPTDDADAVGRACGTWSGPVTLTNDTLAPLRAAARRRRRAPGPAASAPRTRYRRPAGRAALPQPAAARPRVAGRWSRLPERDPDPTRRAAALADAAARTARRGHPGRGRWPSGSPAASPRSTRCWPRWRSAARPAAATSSRGWARPSSPCPARSTGCARWPTPPTSRPGPGRPGPGARRHRPGQPVRRGAALARAGGRLRRRRGPATGHRAGRKAGALVVLVGGDLVLYVERGGRTLLSFTDDPDTLARGRPRRWPTRCTPARSARCRSSAPTARPCTRPRCATR